MAELYVGTSGWSYNEWSGVFYPSGNTSKLSYYSKVFNTVEVDSTFYAFPSKGLVHGWARYTPKGFVFAAKLPKAITHDKVLDVEKGAEADLLRFLGLMKPLIASGKLGPLLIQLPPSCTQERDGERVRRFLEIIPEDIIFAIEFRHPSWLKQSVWEMLKEHNVAKKVKRVYGYFNNHFHGFAVENSLKMLQMLGEASPQQLEVRERATRYIDSKGESRGREKAQGSILEYMSSGG